MNLHMNPAPHVHSSQTTRVLMLHVIIALIPCAAVGVKVFGFPALMLMLVSVLTAVLAEALWQKLTKQPVRVDDLSAAVTGLILALNLPPRAPWWLAVVGGVFAVVVVKGLFGGLGDNFVNPALAARAMLLAAWPKFMTAWVAPGPDAVSAATPLASPGSYTLAQLLTGDIPGSIGEVCKIAVVIGFVYLLLTKTINWRIPAAMVASTFVFSLIFGKNPIVAVLSGGVLFAAVFMATDYVTCPMSEIGQLIYGGCIGLLIVLIRAYSRYPEGVTYAVLLMNVASPLIDRFARRRVYGHGKEAQQG